MLDAFVVGSGGESNTKVRKNSRSRQRSAGQAILWADLHPARAQSEVYLETEDVLGALDGYAVCVMTFGQSGSGKTHTILGEYGCLHCGGC